MALLPRLTLILAGLVFAVIGIGFLVTPESWASAVEILVPTPMARTDLRATYGGFDLAFGVFLLHCARRRAWWRPGLTAAGVAFGGFATGRLVGYVIEGEISRLMLGLLVAELLGVVLCWFALRAEAAG